MITDDVRHEVAMFLRKCDCNTLDCAKCERISEDLFGNKNALCDMNAPLEKFADLIDRGECENVYDGSVQDSCDNGFECSVCGCRVEDEEHYHVSGVWNFCPQCGRRVVKR